LHRDRVHAAVVHRRPRIEARVHTSIRVEARDIDQAHLARGLKGPADVPTSVGVRGRCENNRTRRQGRTESRVGLTRLGPATPRNAPNKEGSSAWWR
jgi:hypothetical protein